MPYDLHPIQENHELLAVSDDGGYLSEVSGYVNVMGGWRGREIVGTERQVAWAIQHAQEWSHRTGAVLKKLVGNQRRWPTLQKASASMIRFDRHGRVSTSAADRLKAQKWHEPSDQERRWFQAQLLQFGDSFSVYPIALGVGAEAFGGPTSPKPYVVRVSTYRRGGSVEEKEIDSAALDGHSLYFWLRENRRDPTVRSIEVLGASDRYKLSRTKSGQEAWSEAWEEAAPPYIPQF
jgi:hypothetical protein